jgi:hypothetical protein
MRARDRVPRPVLSGGLPRSVRLIAAPRLLRLIAAWTQQAVQALRCRTSHLADQAR